MYTRSWDDITTLRLYADGLAFKANKYIADVKFPCFLKVMLRNIKMSYRYKSS